MQTLEDFEKDCISFMDEVVTEFKNDTTELTEEEILQQIFDRR